MIQKALDYIVKMRKPEIFEIKGETYCDKDLERINFNPKAKEIEMSTLSSLVDYIKSGKEGMPLSMFIHVKSPTEVELYSALDYERKREYMVKVNAKVPDFPFNKFDEHEKFCIGVQSKFIDDPATDKALVLKFAGTVESGTIAEYGDNGVTQKATVKQGIASKTEALVPNPVRLRPFRTFIEVEQPVSEFVFRMKQDKYDGIQCAIFEADGGAWKNAAMKNIKEYLEFELADYMGYFTVIS